ncbi:MAG: GNAT family N-acetyltransferase [Candidatus Eisenbacteria bacterium]|nr:GNAT family N-acetyltransferase [Candidatus Eisenbacteria bacterium]
MSEAALDLWDDALSAHDEATLFHTRCWARFVTGIFPRLEDRSREIEHRGMTRHLPLFAWRRAGGLLTTLHSSFPFLYGGPIPAAGIEATDAARLAGLGGHSLRWTTNPFAAPEASHPAEAPNGRVERTPDATHLLELPATEAQYWDEVLSTGKRNDVRRLGKKGVVIEESRAPEDVDAVYALYLASFARWGGRPRFVYPPEFYRGLVSELGGVTRFTVARHEGRLLGGAFTLRAFDKVHYLAGYFDPEERTLRPNVLLQIESIQAAIRAGARWYDFLPSGGHASVEEFKEGLGGQRVQFEIWETRGALHALLERFRAKG